MSPALSWKTARLAESVTSASEVSGNKLKQKKSVSIKTTFRSRVMRRDEFNIYCVLKMTVGVKEAEFLRAVQFGSIGAAVRRAFFRSWLKILRPSL